MLRRPPTCSLKTLLLILAVSAVCGAPLDGATEAAPPPAGRPDDSSGDDSLGPADRQGTRRTEKPQSRTESREPGIVVPMQLYLSGPVLQLSVNGDGPHRFLLDTGAAVSLLNSALATELQLPVVGEAPLGSPAGGEPVKAPLVRMERIEIGGAVFRDVLAAVMDLDAYRQEPDGPPGILSARVFSGMLLTLQYPENQIVIQEGELPGADGAEIFQYEATDPIPIVPVSVGDVRLDVYLDTGSPAAIMLPAKLMDRLTLASKPIEIGRARLVDREVPVLAAQLDGTVEIGRYSMEKPELRFAEFLAQGTIGYQFLRDFAVTLDTRNHRVRLERTSRPTPGSESPPRRRYGMGLEGLEGDALVVAAVAPDSPAQEAGLRVGDRIVKMNGKPMRELETEARAQALRASPLTLVVEREGQILEVRMTL